MQHTRNIVIGLMLLLALVVSPAQAKSACDLPPLMHQEKSEATIQHLETSWNTAMAKGDTDFERCLLTADFLEILHTGELKTRADQLGFTAENAGKNQPIPDLPKITVLMHGNVAVAYATWTPTKPNRKPDQTADYFVWENGLWHVFFSQATPVEGNSH